MTEQGKAVYLPPSPQIIAENKAQVAECLDQIRQVYLNQRAMSDEDWGVRLVLFTEALAPHWPAEVIQKAILRGLPHWRFYPTPAEIHSECKVVDDLAKGPARAAKKEKEYWERREAEEKQDIEYEKVRQKNLKLMKKKGASGMIELGQILEAERMERARKGGLSDGSHGGRGRRPTKSS